MASGVETRRGVERTGQGFRALALATVVAVFGLITLGGVVRVTGSGLGCPDWPLCHGRIIPPMELATLIEYSHRLMTSVVSILVLVTWVAVWRSYRKEPHLMIPATAAVSLLGVQIMLGGITVLTDLSPAIVLAHLATAEALMASVLVVYLMARGRGGWSGYTEKGLRKGDRFPLLALSAAVVAYGLMLSGSYVTVSGADASCSTWPLCNGYLVPEGWQAFVHMSHRYVALGVGVLVGVCLVSGWRRRSQRRDLRPAVAVAGGLFALQVLVGAVNVWLGFPNATKLLHLMLATAVWVALTSVAVLAYSGAGAAGGEAEGG